MYIQLSFYLIFYPITFTLYSIPAQLIHPNNPPQPFTLIHPPQPSTLIHPNLPTPGKIFDITNNYDLSFHFVGICILISGLMLYPIPWIVRKWETPESRELAMGKQAYKVPKPNVVHDMEAGINNIVKT